MRLIPHGNLNDVIPVLACYANNCPYIAKATTHLNNLRIFIEIRF
jgi:hypothetical protein